MFFGILIIFSPLLPLTEVSSQPSAIPGGNPPEGWRSAVGWGDAEFEPGTAGQQSGTLPLSQSFVNHTYHRITVGAPRQRRKAF